MFNYFFIDFNNQQNAYQIIRAYSHFFYELGRFPGNQNLAVVPQGNIPSFINTMDVILPNDLYTKFGATDVRGLVLVQSLTSFNRYLGNSIDISKDGMTEFFHNLSMQALSISYDKIILEFDAISALVRNIDKSIDAEKQKSEDIARLINNYEHAAEKIIMDEVTDSIDKNEVVKLPDNFKPLEHLIHL